MSSQEAGEDTNPLVAGLNWSVSVLAWSGLVALVVGLLDLHVVFTWVLVCGVMFCRELVLTRNMMAFRDAYHTISNAYATIQECHELSLARLRDATETMQRLREALAASHDREDRLVRAIREAAQVRGDSWDDTG